MKNRINLNKYNIRTDLIIDNNIKTNYLKKKEINNNLSITTINVNKKLSKELNKKTGTYITLEFIDITNHSDRIIIQKNLTTELTKLLKKLKIKPNDECLIIGLGNKSSTADSLGPNTIDKIMVTRHLFELNANVSKGIRSVSAITPGVMANTGIETYDIITSLIQKINPKFLIVIDALASSSITRINKTIQITDTGIHPGSGIGNNRKEINKETIGIPVIAIGVPTVVESSIIVTDTINYILKHLSYIKNNYNMNKLVLYPTNKNNYLKTINKEEPNNIETKEISGIIGTLNNEEKKELITEVLNSIDYNMIVTPKEIDYLIDLLSKTISTSINNSLHSSRNNNWQNNIL